MISYGQAHDALTRILGDIKEVDNTRAVAEIIKNHPDYITQALIEANKANPRVADIVFDLRMILLRAHRQMIGL